MTPEQMQSMVKAAQEAGGMERYLLYVVIALAITVVGYVLRDYAANHVRLILALERNTSVMERLEKRLKLEEEEGR